MATRAGRRAWTVAMLSLIAGAGCASRSTGPDLARVRELTSAAELPELRDGDVNPMASDDVRRLLARPLDAETAVRVAVLNNRALRARLREMGIARGQLVQAGLLPNPRVEAEKPVEPEVRYEVGVEYDVTRALLAPMRSRAAAAEMQAARYRAAAAVVALGVEVRAAFYEVQATEQRLALARQSLDALAAGRDAAQALSNAGNIPRLALAGQVAAYERTRALVAQVELDVLAARERLHRRLGLQGAETGWRIRGKLESAPASAPALEKLETRALEASLALADTRSRLEALARRTGVSRAEGWIPDVSVGLRAAEMAPGPDGHAGRRFAAGVTFSVPLFDRNQGTTAALGAEFDALLERHHGAAADIRSVARELASRLESTHARARQYQTVIVPAQRSFTRETLLQFNAMQVGIFQLLAARREELDVELAHVDTLREYWTARAGVEGLLEGGFPGGEAAGSPGGSISIPTENRGGH